MIPWEECETLSTDDVRQQYLRVLRRLRGDTIRAARAVGEQPSILSFWRRAYPGFARDEQLTIDDCEVQRVVPLVDARPPPDPQAAQRARARRMLDSGMGHELVKHLTGISSRQARRRRAPWVEKAARLHAQGWNYAEIGREVGVSKQRVQQQLSARFA